MSREETRLGIDVGGTFTDVVATDDGRLRVHKVPSTPDAPDEGVLDGVDAAATDGVDPAAVGFVSHGTTVTTNAVLERDWADTALITTAGFRDAIEIGRQNRPDVYDLRAEKPRPVVERDARFEVTERLDERGEVLNPLDDDAVRALADDIAADSVAVSLLFAFEDDDHERRVRELLREAGFDGSVSLSSRVLPEIREYERTLATALNAGLKPVMARYLGRLSDGIAEVGIDADLRVMASNGGVTDVSEARERPVNTLLSGPAAGVEGAAFIAERAGHRDVLTMDMGGTSCDVSLVEAGEPLVATDVEVGGYPVSVPMVDVHTVGAGGGSIAWLDAGGALRVGPRSAGADPGPACYGRGGTAPTVTDAQAVLGRIDPGAFLSDADAGVAPARDALESIADDLDQDVRETAAGVVRVANANMTRALRVVSVERGYDPREFALVAFGGAGPLHANALAAELDVPTVVVPRAAGVLSALGLLVADVAVESSASRVRTFDELDGDALASLLQELETDARERLEDSRGTVNVERFTDLRYAGQSFDLRVAVADDSPSLDALADRFHDRHEDRYGYAAPDEPVELVTARVRVSRLVSPPDLSRRDSAGTVADAARAHRTVRFGNADRDTPVYDRAALPTGGEFDGPAVVEGGQTTVVVRPDDAVTVDEDGSLHLEVAG